MQAPITQNFTENVSFLSLLHPIYVEKSFFAEEVAHEGLAFL